MKHEAQQRNSIEELEKGSEGDYYLGSKRYNGSLGYEQDVYYVTHNKIKHYLAVGEDNTDLARDWAFEWLHMFGNPEPEEEPELKTLIKA